MNRLTVGRCRRIQHVALADVTSTRPGTALGAVRNVGSAVVSTARQVGRTRIVVTAIAAAIVVAVVLLVPLPTASEMTPPRPAVAAPVPMIIEPELP